MAYSAPNTSWVAGDPVLYTDMNRIEANTEALHNPPSGSSDFLDVSDYTINSATFANVDGTNFSVTVTITGDTVLVGMNFTLVSAVVAHFDITVDGTRKGGDDGLFSCRWSTANDRGGLFGAIRITGLSAGEHTFALQWKNAGSGTNSTIYGGNGSSGTQNHPSFWVAEVS